ncbi:MAG: chromosomal replication initiator protein DnaA [Bacteriovoracaceae bacterium]|nr:chromosomal replication initiator protein DnaA [Bacteriovoracaceae bacterium]
MSNDDEKFPFSNFLKLPNEDRNKVESLFDEKVSQKGTSPANKGNQYSNEFDSTELNSIKNEINNYLSEAIAPQKYSAYFDGSFSLIKLDQGKAIFSVATDFIKNMIKNQYLSAIEDGIFTVLGKRYTIEITVNSNPNASMSSNNHSILKSIDRHSNSVPYDLGLNQSPEIVEEKIDSRYIEHMEQPAIHNSINPNKTFENFIIGPSNSVAVATAQAAANNPGKTGKYPSLYYYSNSGLGKTHLLHAIGNQLKENFPGKIICLTTAMSFMNEMVKYIKDNKIMDFRKKYGEQIDVLMIDDIHSLSNKERTQEELFHIFNILYEKEKQLIFTSDKKPEEIEGIKERLKTRLQWGLVVDIQPPDLETRIAILKRKASLLDMFLPDDVIELIASSIRKNIRELEGALLRLSAYSDHIGCEIDIEMAKDYLKISPSLAEKNKITLESIASVTAEYYDFQVADLKSPSRVKDISRSRQIAWYLSMKLINCTNKEIATFYNRKDHSTVIHGVSSINKKIKEDHILAKDVATIESKL